MILDPLLRGTGGGVGGQPLLRKSWDLEKAEGGKRAISGNCGGVGGGLSEPGKVCVDIEAPGN